MSAEQNLWPFERAFLAALQARCLLLRGWQVAREAWARFARLVGEMPLPIVRRAVAVHRPLFEAAAAAQDELANELLAAAGLPTVARWRVTALGGFVYVADGNPVELSPLHRAILVRLLDAGERGVALEELAEDIWGDTDIPTQNIHQALYRFRRQTGLGVGIADGVCALQVPAESVAYDVREFERLLLLVPTRETLRAARECYRGSFLAGGIPSANRWIDARRAYLQQRFLDTLEQFTRTIEHETPAEAIANYQYILQIDGCRESTAQSLMEIAARSGMRSLVASTFRHLKGALQRLGADPDYRTTALYQQLR
jgi:DNA-binding SARP family transcriptional activator